MTPERHVLLSLKEAKALASSLTESPPWTRDAVAVVHELSHGDMVHSSSGRRRWPAKERWTALGLMETPEFGISPPERSSL